MIRRLLVLGGVLFMPLAPAANLNDVVSVQLWHAYNPPALIHVAPPGQIQQNTLWRTIPKAGIWLSNTNGKARLCLDSACQQVYSPSVTSVTMKAMPQKPLSLTASVVSKWGSHEPVRLNRFYPGNLVFKPSQVGWTLVNRVPPQEYVTSVVASETLGGWPLEALKVHSVLIQTRLRKHAGAHVDSTEDQRYVGVLESAQPEHWRLAMAATQATWGEWLSPATKLSPAEVFFHSACAGRTSLPDSMSLKRIIAQREAPDGVICRDCQHSPFWREHVAVIPWAQWTPVFGKGVPKILQQDAANRPVWVKLSTGKELSGYDLWLRLGQRFGWDKCPGRRYGFSSSKAGVVVTSTGAGHGVGVCQWGAAQKAREGATYREILKAYYPALVLHSPKK